MDLSSARGVFSLCAADYMECLSSDAVSLLSALQIILFIITSIITFY